jgi:hypothetical protein
MPESLGFKYDVFVSQTNQKRSFMPLRSDDPEIRDPFLKERLADA